MKMLWSPRSPFVRKTLICAHELGLAESLTLIPATVGSALLSPEVMAISPLNRIPALLKGENGAAPETEILGSGNICRYLSAMSDGAVVPAYASPAYWDATLLESIGDGIMDNNVLRLGDMLRPQDSRSEPHLEAFKTKTTSALNWLEDHAALLSGDNFCVGKTSIAAALSHLDFRFETDNWRQNRPKLQAWYEGIAQRPAMIETAYK